MIPPEKSYIGHIADILKWLWSWSAYVNSQPKHGQIGDACRRVKWSPC